MSFATVAIVGGIGLGIAGTIQTDKGIKAETQASEAVLQFNAAESRRKAKRVRKVGAEAGLQLRTDLRRQLARNRVAAAAGGAEFEGSPLDAELFNISQAAVSIATLEENIQLQSFDLETLADFQLAQEHDIGEAGKKKRSGNILSGIGSAISKIF